MWNNIGYVETLGRFRNCLFSRFCLFVVFATGVSEDRKMNIEGVYDEIISISDIYKLFVFILFSEVLIT
jgi:hypothetical protein